VGIKAAVHGVDPEAVKEAHHSKLMQCGPVFSAFIVFIGCGNNLPISVEIKACVKSCRYPLTSPNRCVPCALLFGFLKLHPLK
jgi:hypothetical protein